MPDYDPDIAVVVTGESLADALDAADLSPHQPMHYAGTVYAPVWPGCSACQFERDEAGDDPLDAATAEGVYAWDEDGESGFYCAGCEREVEREVDAVELLTDRWGPNDSDTNRLILDRVFGYFPTGDDISGGVYEFARRQWVENARAILAHVGLLDAGDQPLMLEENDWEFL